MKEIVSLKTLKDREKEARRNLILDAAERVFATKPFDRASMREIAGEAGMSVSSIYRFFDGQEALLVGAAIRATRNWIAIMEKIRDRFQGKPLKAFEKMIDSYIDYISENDSYFQMMMILMAHGNIEWKSFREIDNVMNDVLHVLDQLFVELGYRKNTRMLSRHFYISMIGIIVSYNKLQHESRRQTVALMKRHARMTYELMVNCSREKLEQEILT